MPEQALQLETLAKKYALMQRDVIASSPMDTDHLQRHIRNPLCRCLPACMISDSVIADCLCFITLTNADNDPMHIGAIHAFAGDFLLHTDSADPLLIRLHHAACRFLPSTRAAARDDLRLVTLAALYEPHLLPPGEGTAYIRHRLGLRDGIPRTCEEIAVLMHKPLVYIHELEAALLTTLSQHAGGSHA